MINKRLTSGVVGLIVGAVGAIATNGQATPATPSSPTPKRPNLVVGIVVDGLSMDYIRLLSPHFSDGGFKRLLQQGVTITDLDYGTPLDCGASAAMLFTGASPSTNGITAETIYDPTSRQPVSPLADPDVLGNYTDQTLSPRNLSTSTIGDELRIDQGGLGYVYAIAPESVEALVMGGHAGNSAFWITDNNGRWATTTYYKDLPQPIGNANRMTPLENRLDTLQWTPLVSLEQFPDLPSYRKIYPFRHTFPRSSTDRYKAYKNSPAVNADITRMAADYVHILSLGKRDNTDMLNIGYTLQPFLYGREADNRAELMDSYLRLDRNLAQLFEAIDTRGPGMNNTMVFIAGTPPSGRSRRDDEKWNIPYGEFSSRKAVSLLNMYLMALHGNGEWVSGYHNGQMYLNRKLIKERNKNLEEMRGESARFLTRMSGVNAAYTVDEIIDRRGADNPDALRRSINPATAGDIFVTVAPGWSEIDDDNDTNAPQTTVRHASTFAPAFILAPGVTPATITGRTDARVLAPTVSGLLRIRAPNGASEAPLRF